MIFVSAFPSLASTCCPIDTSNPVERVIAYNVESEPVDGVKVVRGDESCIADFDPVPRAALILVAAE